MISQICRATTAKRLKIDPYYQRHNCSPLNVLISDVYDVLGANSSEDDSASQDEWIVGDASELSSRRFVDADVGEDRRELLVRTNSPRIPTVAH